MGMTVWFNVRDGDKHTSDGTDRSAIFDLQEQLDALATSLGVEPISTFFDETDLRYNMDDDGEFESPRTAGLRVLPRGTTRRASCGPSRRWASICRVTTT